jgi:hypothetical protein
VAITLTPKDGFKFDISNFTDEALLAAAVAIDTPDPASTVTPPTPPLPDEYEVSFDISYYDTGSTTSYISKQILSLDDFIITTAGDFDPIHGKAALPASGASFSSLVSGTLTDTGSEIAWIKGLGPIVTHTDFLTGSPAQARITLAPVSGYTFMSVGEGTAPSITAEQIAAKFSNTGV